MNCLRGKDVEIVSVSVGGEALAVSEASSTWMES